MIGVCAKPFSSSAWRIAATWPSIIADGATMSAPACACESAVRARSGSVASLSTSPSLTTPQWPWLVYSQRQTSVMTRSVGVGLLEGAHRLLDDAVGGVGLASPARPSPRVCRRGGRRECRARAAPAPRREAGRRRAGTGRASTGWRCGRRCRARRTAGRRSPPATAASPARGVGAPPSASTAAAVVAQSIHIPDPLR